MSTEIRRRQMPQSIATAREACRLTMVSCEESHLSAQALLGASPIHSGVTMKMHVPIIYSFLPSSIQWILSSRCCPKSWSPQWKQRYLIALGSYLYKFKNDNGSSPKGSPLPIETSEVRMISRDDVAADEFNIVTDCLPPDCNAVFEVTSVGKTQYFAVQSREEAMIWVNSLRQMRQDTITWKMGHSKGIPYPSVSIMHFHLIFCRLK